MGDQPNFRMRVMYQKSGRLALLSHLEVIRALERAVRRADLPYAITEGFSPHMKIAFGSALPVGVGGQEECFDLSMTRYIAPDKALESLKASSPPDLMVHSCVYVDNKAPAASVAFPRSLYEVMLSEPLSSPPVVPETIVAVRKGKEKELIVSDYLEEGIQFKEDKLYFSLCAKPTGSLRVDAFLEKLLQGCPDIDIVSITRIRQETF